MVYSPPGVAERPACEILVVPQVTLPTPSVVTAPPTAEPAAAPPAIEVPEERPQSVTPARKPRGARRLL